jgi:hypothetical protein
VQGLVPPLVERRLHDKVNGGPQRASRRNKK